MASEPGEAVAMVVDTEHPPPQPDNHGAPQDITRCPCGDNEDQDGFMIQCEKCLAWQHGDCLGIGADTTPEHYHCELCEPNHPIHLRYKQLKEQLQLSLKKRARPVSVDNKPDKTNKKPHKRKRLAKGAKEEGGLTIETPAPAPMIEDEYIDDQHERQRLSREERKLKMYNDLIQQMEEREKITHKLSPRESVDVTKVRKQSVSTGVPPLPPAGLQNGVTTTHSENHSSAFPVSHRPEPIARQTITAAPAAPPPPKPALLRSSARLPDETCDELRRRHLVSLSPMYFGRKAWMLQQYREELRHSGPAKDEGSTQTVDRVMAQMLPMGRKMALAFQAITGTLPASLAGAPDSVATRVGALSPPVSGVRSAELSAFAVHLPPPPVPNAASPPPLEVAFDAASTKPTPMVVDTDSVERPTTGGSAMSHSEFVGSTDGRPPQDATACGDSAMRVDSSPSQLGEPVAELKAV